jgi:serine protease inhibitor ecotin
MEGLTFRELHGIKRDPNWPHHPECGGHCIGCQLEDVTLERWGEDGREFVLMFLMKRPSARSQAALEAAKKKAEKAPAKKK